MHDFHIERHFWHADVVCYVHQASMASGGAELAYMGVLELVSGDAFSA